MDSVPSIPLADELRRRGIRPSRRLGQNFMIDRQMLDFLVRTAGVTACDMVLEIGTGAGFLTERLCECARHVISVEIDSALYELSAERLAAFPNLTLVNADALSSGHSWGDDVANALKAAGRLLAHKSADHGAIVPLKLVSNLPYASATAIVQTMLESDPPFDGAWFTCQWEVAERLRAAPGSADYGYISVLVSLTADVRVVRKLGPSVFWPRPKVDSAIVELLPSAAKRAAADNVDGLRDVISLLFSQRRKELLGVLKSAKFDASVILKVREMLQLRGLDERLRVFQLAPDVIRDIVALFPPKSR